MVMAQTVAQVMTRNPITVAADAPVTTAAERMREADIGAVIVEDHGRAVGILTDRDIAVRVVAENRDLSTPAGQVCSATDVRAVSPDTPLQDAVTVMRTAAVRRLPVVQDGHAVGIVSLGDLAIERDGESALADISAAEPNK